MAEAVPDTELHGPRDCMREPMDVLAVIQSVDVKAGTFLIMYLTGSINVESSFSSSLYV